MDNQDESDIEEEEEEEREEREEEEEEYTYHDEDDGEGEDEGEEQENDPGTSRKGGRKAGKVETCLVVHLPGVVKEGEGQEDTERKVVERLGGVRQVRWAAGLNPSSPAVSPAPSNSAAGTALHHYNLQAFLGWQLDPSSPHSHPLQGAVQRSSRFLVMDLHSAVVPRPSPSSPSRVAFSHTPTITGTSSLKCDFRTLVDFQLQPHDPLFADFAQNVHGLDCES